MATAPIPEPARPLSGAQLTQSHPIRAARAELELRGAPRISTRDPEVVPLPPASTEAQRSGARRQLLWVWIPVAVTLVLLDVTFPLWFWRVPKLTPATGDYGYQFLVDAHRLETEPPAPQTVQVLGVGSSIA